MHNLYPFLYNLDPRATWPGFFSVLIVAVGALAVVIIHPRPGSVWRPRFIWFGSASILVLFTVQFAIMIVYVAYSNYIDDSEPAIVAASWLGWQGSPFYPPVETGDVYGVPYGPVLLQANGFILWLFGPSVAASKILGAGAFVTTQILAFVVFRRSGATFIEALTFVGTQCLLQSAFNVEAVSAFGANANPPLFLVGEASILTAISRPTNANAAILGLAAGVAMNLKLHGALYILPPFIFFLFQAESTMRLRLAVVSALTAAIALAAPFLLGNVSVLSYLHTLQLLSKHGIDRWMIERNLVFGMMSLIPILWFYLLFAPRLPSGFGWFLTTAIVCIGVVSIIGAKPGSGTWHLLPFLPSLLWAFFIVRRRAQDELISSEGRALFEAGTLVLIIGLFFGYGPLVAISWDRTVSAFRYKWLPTQSATDEINKVLDHNPGLRIAIGPSDATLGFNAAALRVIPVFRGNPLPFDATTWGDRSLAGISDRVISELVRGCPTDLWLFPSGTPFGKYLVSDVVMADFYLNYKKEGSGQVFDRWRCISSPLIR